MVRRDLAGRLLVLLVALFVAACSSGPPADEVKRAVQAQLDAALDGRVLTVARFTRAGSAPLRGAEGRVVHFNALLVLERDYDFTRWDAHNVASLAALVGAGPQGVVGLRPEGNRKGDEIGVYGNAAFVPDGSDWRLVTVAPPEAGEARAAVPAATVSAIQPAPREQVPPSALEQALDAFAALARAPLSPALSRDERDAILLEETTEATQRARRRLAHAENLIVLAAGPPGGAYAETRAALLARAAAAHVPFDAVHSEGSVANVRLLSERKVQFALVQNDVARNAALGRGRFSAAPQADLRAVASLFPEPVHLVVRAGSAVAGPQDLRGKRVSVGPEGSGTRSNAIAVLAAHGLALDALAEAAGLDLPAGLRALAEGRLDAAFATVHAPAAEVQRAFAAHPLALVAIGPSPALLDAGLVALTLPPRTYAGQSGPVPTVASTALLVTRADVSDAQVDAVLALLYERREGAATAAVSRIDADTARAGVAIPWHPRAEAVLARRPVPAPPVR